jgi:pimeloyl-ACP methyl ester carboxylesterase
MKTVYLLCGLLCDADVWVGQASALQSRYDVRVVSFEQFDSIEAMARHVLADAPPVFALAGHSMGGRVALEVYRQAPHRVERLALLDTGFEGMSEGEPGRRAVLVDQANAQGIDSIAAAWGLPMLCPRSADDPALVQRVFDMVGRMSAAIYAGQTRALLGRPDATDVLGRIDCPTLILCGRQDTWSPPARHEQMARMVPHSELVSIDDCGHMSMMEQPAQVLAALETWLAERAA